MSSNVKDVLQAPIIRFDSIDSTNNRAAQMIDADKSVEGLTIVTKQQTAGKGQRGNIWKDEPAQSLLMSMVLHPKVAIDAQFSFSAAVAVAVATLIQNLSADLNVCIKFPNDIIINDKKAAGILIENALRGNQWTHAIIGLGINVHQRSFDNLPNAISLYLATGKDWDIDVLMYSIREKIIENTQGSNLRFFLDCYNDLLYKKGKKQYFSDKGNIFEATILNVSETGQLMLQLEDGNIQSFAHGEFSWIW